MPPIRLMWNFSGPIGFPLESFAVALNWSVAPTPTDGAVAVTTIVATVGEPGPRVPV